MICGIPDRFGDRQWRSLRGHGLFLLFCWWPLSYGRLTEVMVFP